MLCSTGDDPEREKEYMKILRSNIVDGVIMGVNNQKPEAYAEFGKPLVMLDYYVNDEVPVVVSDHEMGGRLAAEEFIRSGCRYVLHIGNEADTERVLSYKSHRTLRETLEKKGIKTREVDIKWNSFDFQNYFEMASLILENNPEIDGIMAADMPASAFLKAALKIGKKVPEEFAVIAYDGTYVARTNLVEITMIHQQLGAIGNRAVDTILKLISGEKPEEKHITIPVEFKKGSTT